MAIRISLGNVGSGKTVSEVRALFRELPRRTTYTNILLKKPCSHVKVLTRDMILKSEVVKTVKKRGGDLEPVYQYKLNVDFWKSIKEPINIVIDEAHTIFNARRAQSHLNIVMGDWIALIRRVLGSVDAQTGELVFITQLPNRLDVIAREMSNQVRYHVCRYIRQCSDCFTYWRETSEQTEPRKNCPNCNGYNLIKKGHQIEIYKFPGMSEYMDWKFLREGSYYDHLIIKDIEQYFPLYDTLQWENLITDS